MKILIVLVIGFVLSFLGIRLSQKKTNLRFAGRIALSLMLLYSVLGGLFSNQWLQSLLPNSIELSNTSATLSAIAEMSFAIGIHLRVYRKAIAWVLIAYLLFILPPILYTAINTIYIDPRATENIDNEYLWFRIPIQFFAIVCVYLSVIRTKKT